MKDSWYRMARVGAVMSLVGALNGCDYIGGSSSPSEITPATHSALRKMSEEDAATWLIQKRVGTLAASFPEDSVARAVYTGNSPGLGTFFDLPVLIELSQKPFTLTTFGKPRYGAVFTYLNFNLGTPIPMQQIQQQPVTIAFSREWLDADPRVQVLAMRKEALRIETWVGMGMAILQDLDQRGRFYPVDGEITRRGLIHSLVRTELTGNRRVWKLFDYAPLFRVLNEVQSLAETNDPKVLEDLEKTGMLNILRKAQAAKIDFRPEVIEKDFRWHAFDRREPWPRLILSDPDISTPPLLSWSGEF